MRFVRILFFVPRDVAGLTIRPIPRKISVSDQVRGGSMYAVIRSGGKQYRVAPGDVIRVEKLEQPDGKLDLGDVIAVRGDDGTISLPDKVRVTAEIVGQGLGAKILVFHYKRKKQYKKLAGHRQQFTSVKITGINLGK